MTSSDSNPAELDWLVSTLLDNKLNEQETLRLEAMISASTIACDRYLDLVVIHSQLQWRAIGAEVGVQLDQDTGPAKDADLNDAMIMPAIRLEKKVEVPKKNAALESPTRSAPKLFEARRRPWIMQFRQWRWAAVVLLSLGGLLAIFALQKGRANTAATITATVDAAWDQEAHPNGEALPVGTPLHLKSGFAELHFADGAKVIAEGPAEMVIRSGREMLLAAGKVYAVVPGGGFVVNTPVATVTDLGTEFGVNVSSTGQCQTAVYKGKVQIDAKGQARDQSPLPSVVLAEGDAMQISSETMIPMRATALSQAFARTLEPVAVPLDMVDLAAGGDGTTHHRGTGIDSKGEWPKIAPVLGVSGDGAFHPVPGLAAVDGVFIPSGRGRSTQLDSAHHSFVFPGVLGTSNNLIWAAAAIPSLSGEQIPTVMDGIDYSASGHGLLYLHAACGITFDLNAIRNLHPGVRIVRFHTLFGNLYPGPQGVHADAWVFIDGRSVFSAHNFSNVDAPKAMSTTIADNDRFLTLVTGYAARINANCWIVAADPVLETTHP